MQPAPLTSVSESDSISETSESNFFDFLHNLLLRV